MNTMRKMQILSDTAQYDLCDYVNHQKQSRPNLPGIYYSTGSNGCQIPLFKVLMSNKCCNDCKYCVNHKDRNFTRMELTPEELSRFFLNYYQNNYVNGLFLSSGISGDIDSTMEKVVEVARLLRLDYGYNDYIHLKIIPGASKDIIKRAMGLANRVSVNIETATPEGLSELTTTKDYQKDILRRLKWINRIHSKNPKYAPSGQTTQMIIGATDETDEDILNRVKWLYKNLNVKRTYFSSFQPLQETPLENLDEPHPQRSGRLYQADALINSYNFKIDELVFDDSGLLNMDQDPKYTAALNMDIFPLEINQASYKDLLRVPGIGAVSAKRIIAIRKKRPFQKLADLKKVGVVVSRAEPFIKLKGTYQMALDNY
ncbi:putative DNA modification/repair radical SAM protein [Methanobacterium alcaliphilum]|uniref:putative DNA modification/repair radical SAM protein n=1 Tax=Methanobacterium alcaliphilum TaxID=392018 RepID=UPI00200B1C29|nr:putative DNA modification/repair radical SAM protein [Methanobacterium alcaliphilum]MCK9151170.1 putative DNA modification/repair radical SAM protein [Methanobacterium alcaliphilum]